MDFKQRARLIMIAAMGALVILSWVVARATNHAYSAVLFVVGVFLLIVGLILAGVGTLQRWRRERSR
jgi:uncharacterized membrane protein YidH (DUF202 family)